MVGAVLIIVIGCVGYVQVHTEDSKTAFRENIGKRGCNATNGTNRGIIKDVRLMKTHTGEAWVYDIELDDVVRVAPIDNVLVVSPSESCPDGSPGQEGSSDQASGPSPSAEQPPAQASEYPYPFQASKAYRSMAEPPAAQSPAAQPAAEASEYPYPFQASKAYRSAPERVRVGGL